MDCCGSDGFAARFYRPERNGGDGAQRESVFRPCVWRSAVGSTPVLANLPTFLSGSDTFEVSYISQAVLTSADLPTR